MTSSKSILFLLGLLYLQARVADAAISTSAGFPQDVFAKPAFNVYLGSLDKHTVTLPIKRRDALNILEQQEASSSSSFRQALSADSRDLNRVPSSLAVPGQSDHASSQAQDATPRILSWSLQRSSPNQFQLCAIPDFSFTPADKHSSSHHASASTRSLRSRNDLIRNAQALLDPLKKVCLYHTTEWFTYSFCHGREIRQFRRLGAHTAAQKAFKAAGGGEAGKKAALEAADKVNSLQHPVADPEFPAYILGRWTPQSEDIVGDDRAHQRRQQQPHLSDTSDPSTGVAAPSNHRLPSIVNSAGLDLVEQVQFGDWDEEELFAAEAKALEQVKESPNNAVQTGRTTGSAGQESQRNRYLTQRWTNGTMCDMNHQPRTVEVQFHCSSRKPLEDRIVTFKETTICNYVLVIETPRLCADPAFGSEKEEAPLPIRCHQVVDDGYPGATLGDPDRVAQPLVSEIDAGTEARNEEQSDVKSAKSTKEGEHSTSDEAKATVGGQPGQEASTASHTYGDRSHYGSVHDDYYDEALGGPGALYQQYNDNPEHDHDHDHGREHGDALQPHGDEFDEAEIVVEIGLDEEGRLLVNKVDSSAAGGGPPASEGKEARRREGKKRNDDDRDSDNADNDAELEIQLDTDDFLSVLRGEGGSLEKKLAEKISQVLNKRMQRDHKDADESSDKKKAKTQTSEDVAKLYQRLMSTVTGGGKKTSSDGVKGRKGQSKQGPALRMEKVGDSLAERAKRFYDAKARKSKEAEKSQQHKTPSPVQPHPEL